MDETHIKQRLIDLRNELLELDDSSRESASTVELDQSRMGRLSRMDALQAQEISKEARRRRTRLLQRIEPALNRLGNGNYGYCEDCDETIAAARLEFDPTCSTCITCANLRENT